MQPKLQPQPGDLFAARVAETSASAREFIESNQFSPYLQAVDDAGRNGEEIATTITCFRQDAELLYQCLLYAHTRGVRICLEPLVLAESERSAAADEGGVTHEKTPS